jgi:hypothetical protein
MQVELIRQILALGIVIAGFAFTVAMQLLSLNKSNISTSFSISTFTISAITMLIASWSSAVILIATAGGVPLSKNPAILVGVSLSSFLIGIFTFLLGITFAGFIHNKNIGLIFLIVAIFAMIVMILVGQVLFIQ